MDFIFNIILFFVLIFCIIFINKSKKYRFSQSDSVFLLIQLSATLLFLVSFNFIGSLFLNLSIVYGLLTIIFKKKIQSVDFFFLMTIFIIRLSLILNFPNYWFLPFLFLSIMIYIYCALKYHKYFYFLIIYLFLFLKMIFLLIIGL